MATVQMPENRGDTPLPSNSLKVRGMSVTPPQPSTKLNAKLVKAKAKGHVKKKSSVTELFFDNDLTTGDIVKDLAKNTLVPRIKETIFDMAMGYLSMKLFNGGHAVNRNTFMRNGMSINSRINYAGYSNTTNNTYGTYGTNSMINAAPRRTDLNISGWEFDYKDDADLVLGVLSDTALEYGSVSVAVFYQQLINLGIYSGDYDYTLQHWGWYKDAVMRAKVIRSRGGWIIDIERAGSLR